MINLFIDQLDISNVHQKRRKESSVDIYFTLNDRLYSLLVVKIREKPFSPLCVYHECDQDCGICGKEYEGQISECTVLNTYCRELFHRLIEMPSIRLEWLFLPYKGREEG